MHEEYKLNKEIKQDGVDTQSEILDELKRRYPQYVKQSGNKQAPAKKRRLAVISAIAAVVACVAIIVPCAVLLPDRDNGKNSGKDNIRYCTQEEYEKNYVEFTIGEYRETNNLNFLCFDWYGVGEDFSTSCYTSISDNEILCLAEQAYLPRSDEYVQLSITKANVYLSEFDSTISICINKQSVENHAVKWIVNGQDAICIFEDNGYRYFIQIELGQDENRLFELVSELLGTK